MSASNMSLAVRRTLLCRTFVLGVIDMCRTGGSPEFHASEAVAILARLERLADEVFRQTTGSLKPLVFSRKTQKQFESSLNAVKRTLLERMPEGDADPRAYIALVTLWIEDHKKDAPPQRRFTWFQIAQELQKLGDLLNPEGDAAPVDAGVAYGEATKEASGVW